MGGCIGLWRSRRIDGNMDERIDRLIFCDSNADSMQNAQSLIPLISLSDVGEARGLSLGGNRDETLWAMIIEPLGMLASTDSMMLHRLMWRAGGWNR